MWHEGSLIRKDKSLELSLGEMFFTFFSVTKVYFWPKFDQRGCFSAPHTPQPTFVFCFLVSCITCGVKSNQTKEQTNQLSILLTIGLMCEINEMNQTYRVWIMNQAEKSDWSLSGSFLKFKRSSEDLQSNSAPISWWWEKKAKKHTSMNEPVAVIFMVMWVTPWRLSGYTEQSLITWCLAVRLTLRERSIII